MVSQQLIEIIIKATDEASATAEKVDNSIKKIGNSTKTLGNTSAFDGIKSKLSGVASTLDGKFGGALTKAKAKFDSLKATVTGVATSIKSKLGTAVDSVKGKFATLGNSLKGTSKGFTMLRGAASMAAGMIGYDLVSSLVENTRASLNARSSIQAFGSRLSMSGAEVQKFQSDLDELQSTFKKVDMDVIGQQAMDMAYRLGLPKTSLTALTETSAIFTDAMQRNGRSAEDATLALADAMDGEFKRLKEIGISQDDLMKNGWSGDINDKTGLLNAMNKALKEQHYDELAKSVDNLDDAWQVLSITLGNLLEGILVPLTPVIVGVLNGFISMIDGIKNAWNGLPDFAKLGIAIVGISAAILLIAGVLWATYIPAWVAAAGATWMAIAPVLPIVLGVAAAIAVLVAAIFEVGKAFGWWTDIGSMFDAIKAGVMRLWDAFINHPDVQAAISMISNALSTLWSWIQQAGQAVLEFFGITSSGNFDIVATVIQTIGGLWEAFKGTLLSVIGVVTSVYNTINWVFTTIWSVVGPIIMQIVGLVQGLIGAFNSFRTGQLSLPQLVMTVLTLLANTYLRIFTYIGQLVVKFGQQLVSRGLSAARGFVMAIVNWVRQLPSRVYSLLIQVVSRIRSGIQAWISAASQKVSSLITTITSPFSGVAGAISGALSGVVNAIKAPFEAAWNAVKPIVDKIQGAMKLIGARGGETAAGGETGIATDTSTGGVFNISTGQYVNGENKLVIEDNLNVTLDFKNVPAHISTGQLIEALGNKEVLNALVNNRDFQSIDAQVKQRISLKNSRSGR